VADGLWRIPPDGRTVPKYTTARDFYFPAEWKPGDPGYVRVTSGEYKDNDIRSSIYKGTSMYPFWQEPAVYFVSRPFSIQLPAGKWRLAVERGLEYLPVFEEFEVRPGETRKRKIVLERWVDMPKMGWYSGDDHVHFPRTRREHNEFLLTWGRAEDVHLLNILRMGDSKATYFEQEGYGRQSQYREGDYALVSGQEDPRDVLGHAIALDIRQPVRDVSQYRLYDSMFDRVREQGGLTGYAHLAWSSPLDANINVPRHRIDFVEILQFRRLGTEDYYDFLNLGYRLVASAGSDLPWGNTIGEVRVYVYTGRHFSPEAWFQAFRLGRTFVTNGPMLTLQAGSALPGGEVRLKRNGAVNIRIRAWAPPETGTPKRLELVSQGRVIQTVEAKAPKQRELRIDYSLRPDRSGWIAARVETENGGFAHTSPIYLAVDGVPGIQPREIVEKRMKLLEQIGSRLGGTTVAGLDERIAEARAIYRRMLTSGQ
jgi:hypothetical protein